MDAVWVLYETDDGLTMIGMMIIESTSQLPNVKSEVPAEHHSRKLRGIPPKTKLAELVVKRPRGRPRVDKNQPKPFNIPKK